MSAFSDIDTSFLNDINAERLTPNESNINDIRFQGSPLAELRGTSNETTSPIYSRDRDNTPDHSRKITETSTSSTPIEYNPIDDLLSLPEGGSHVANIPNEPDSPMVLSNNLP